AEILPRLEFRPLEVDPLPGLPRDYVAVKAYFNECVPDSPANERFLTEVVGRLARATDVVMRSTGLLRDDHREWAVRQERVHLIEDLLRPEDNLAVQTRIIAGARGFAATYGGFSYLGALLGVPTLTFYELEQTVPIHLEVLAAMAPGASYERVHVDDTAALER